MITERPGVGPLRTRCLQFVGADPNITEVRTLLIRPGSEEAVYRAVATHIREASGAWDWMSWTGVDSSSTPRAAFQS